MGTFRIVTNVIMWVLIIALWVMLYILRKRIKEYKSAEMYQSASRESFEGMAEETKRCLAEWRSQAKHIYATYKFTESDFIKFGNNHQGMEKEARQRMACALGRRIVKDLGATEIVEDGKLIGYRIDVEVRKTPVEKYVEATWKEEQS